MKADGSERRRVSNGEGKTTCSYFFPAGERILYALDLPRRPGLPAAARPLPRLRLGAGRLRHLLGEGPTAATSVPLFASPAYDAEATISPDGTTIVFTSARDGDLEIYTMNADGSDVKRLTHAPGYDGGPFFSERREEDRLSRRPPEDRRRTSRATARTSRATPMPRAALEIRVMNADGSDDHAVTSNGAANFAPYFLPGGSREIIFSSNLGDPKGREFELYSIREDGTNLTRVTYSPDFDGFPMLTRDGKRLVFAVQPQRAEAARNQHLRRRLGPEVAVRRGRGRRRRGLPGPVLLGELDQRQNEGQDHGTQEEPDEPERRDPAEHAEERR